MIATESFIYLLSLLRKLKHMQVLCTEAPYEAERQLSNWAQETFDKYNLMLTQKAAKENKFININVTHLVSFTRITMIFSAALNSTLIRYLIKFYLLNYNQLTVRHWKAHIKDLA